MGKKILILSALLITVMGISGCWSCGSYHDMKGDGPVDPSVEHKFFWDKECVPMAKKAAPAKEAKAEPAKEAPCAPCEAAAAQSGLIKVEKIMPAQVQINRPFEYKIKATNMSSHDVHEVSVAEELSDNFKFASAAPAAKQTGNVLVWNLGTLTANQSKEMVVKGSATSTKAIEVCATVDYVCPSCATVAVVEPMLDITHTAPQKVVICDQIPLTITVKNNGTGAAENVKITSKLPKGLVTVDGKSQVDVNVGTLAAGEAKEFKVATVAKQTGSYETVATAKADGLDAESAKLATIVTQPALKITKTGPETTYLGRSVEYEIVVTNTGDEAAVDTMIQDTIPAGVTNVAASAGGQVSGNTVVWAIGSLAPEASKTVKISYTPSDAGKFGNKATATAVCAEAVAASASTAIKGIPALLLEVIDVEDPIEVGKNETYVITVTNQGTAVATNVVVKSFFEDTMQYVSSSGATNGSYSEALSFAPLPKLAPGAKATWNVVVKAVKAGDVRFRVTMNSDQLDRDVQETESTYFYE